MKYKIGDKVKIRSDLKANEDYGGWYCTQGMAEIAGKIFAVIGVRSPGEGYYLNCGFYCVFTDAMLEPVMPTWRIIIEGDESTSRAKYIVGKKVIKEATAKRYNKDKHDPGMAAVVLTNKMFPDIVSAEPESPKYFNGRIVCVMRANGIALTVGKIYEVKDGSFIKDCGRVWPALDSNKIVSVERTNEQFGGYFRFIEIKE